MLQINFKTHIVFGSITIGQGDVITSGYSNNSWIFSTVYSEVDGYHPVSGNRKFGFTNNNNGTYTFFTRGIDRVSSNWNEFKNWVGSGFENADKLWKSLMSNIAKDFGASAKINKPITYRPDIDKIKKVLMVHLFLY